MNVLVTERCERVLQMTKWGSPQRWIHEDNDTIHVQRLKSVKLYNNPMDETTRAEMENNDRIYNK